MSDGLPRICVSMGRKVNLGNFESADVNITLSGITPYATQEDIEGMLKTASLAFSSIKQELASKVMDARASARAASDAAFSEVS